MKSTTRNQAAAILAVSLLLLAGGIWYYTAQKKDIHSEQEQDLAAIAELKVSQIVNWQHERLGDAVILTESPFFRQGVDRWMNRPGPAAAGDILDRFTSLRKSYGYEDIMLVDTAGAIRLSLSGTAGSIDGYALQSLRQAMAERRPVITDLHAGDFNRSPHISVIAPVTAPGDTASPVRCAVVMMSDPGTFLYPLIQTWPMPSRTAETLLMRSDGDNVLFLNELRHRSGTALRLRIPMTRGDVPAIMAVQGSTGVVRGNDYRNVPVIAVIRPVPETGWFLISKIDEAEAFRFWRTQGSLILGMLFLLVAAAALMLLSMWQRSRKAHYRQLYLAESSRRAAEERYGTTLKSIGDAVISTDAQGRVEMMNPVAEQLTGWTLREAAGRPLDEVFRIISQETREVRETPVKRVLREGTIVGLANHTALIARNGTERVIADSGAPIHGADGAITGVVLVFRDMTDEYLQERLLQESRQRLETLMGNLPGAAYRSLNAPGWPKQFISDGIMELTGYAAAELTGPAPRASYADLIHPDDRAQVRDAVERGVAAGGMFETEYRVTRRDGTLRWVWERGRAVENSPGGTAVLEGFISDITAWKEAEKERDTLQAQLLQAQKMESIGRLAGGIAHDFNNMLQIILGNTALVLDRTGPAEPFRRNLEEVQSAGKRSAELTRQLLAFARRQITMPRVLDLNDTVSSMLRMLKRLIGEDIDLAWLPAPSVWPVNVDPSQIDQILANLCVNARDAMQGSGKVTIETADCHHSREYCNAHPDCTPGDFVMLAVSDNGCGMDDETRANIFEPFFTTKPVNQGTGLGLATVYGIIRQNNGFINVYSEPGKGTTFRLYFPRHTAGAGTGEPAEPDAAALPRGSGETVLLVEDEEAILSVGSSMLERLGYRVITARSARLAISAAAAHTGPIPLLITDVILPGMNGRELAAYLLKERPEMKVLYMSGYTANVIAHHGVLDKHLSFLPKPFSSQQLAGAVHTVLAGAE